MCLEVWLTFSFMISPVSVGFDLPLAGLLHSTRGSYMNVFKTLKGTEGQHHEFLNTKLASSQCSNIGE